MPFDYDYFPGFLNQAFPWDIVGMLRITKTAEKGPTICLKVEGRVVGDLVSEFDKVCRSSLAQGKVISLDFTGVLFIDHQGVETVKGMLGERKVQLTGASPLVQDLLGL